LAVKLKPVFQAMQSHLQASGYFPGGVEVGEPKSAPADYHAALILGDAAHVSTTLASSIEQREIIIRVYVNAMELPREDIEFALDEIMAEVEADLLGDFTLEVTGVRNIMPLGINSRPGYQDVSGTIFRVLDISIPLMIDGSATFAP